MLPLPVASLPLALLSTHLRTEADKDNIAIHKNTYPP